MLDTLLARHDVDPQRIAVIGIGHSGYLAARGLCFEPRFAAAVADPGVVDLAGPWLDALPALARRHLEARDHEAFNRELHLAELFSPTLSATLDHDGQPFGLDHRSRFELYRTICAYRLGDELSRLDTPLLITHRGEDQWPRQAQRLFDRCLAAKALVCQPSEAVIFDWLEQQLGSEAHRP